MSYDPEEFHSYFRLFELEGHSPEWPLFKSPEATELLRNKATSYGGLISVSHFIRAFNELRASGSIRQVRNPLPPEPLEPELTPEQFHSLPSAVVQRRWKSDPEFRAQAQSLMDAGKI